MNFSKDSQNLEREEIDLLDCLKVIIKNRNIIFLFFIAGILFPLAVFFLTPKTYEAEAVIQVGILRGGLIENPEGMVAKTNFLEKYRSLKITAVPDSSLIGIKNTSFNRDQAVNPVADISSQIISDHEDILESGKNKLEEEIRDFKLAASQLMQSGQQIVPIQLKIFELQSDLSKSVSSKIIKAPEVHAVEEKNVFLNLIVGAVLGIFLGAIAVFLKEWWDRNKSSLKKSLKGVL